MIVTRPINTNYSSLDRHLALQTMPVTLKLGQVIDAVVLSSSRQGHVNLRIGDRVIDAATTVALRQNSHLLLEVVQTQPQLLLRLMHLPGEAESARPLQQAMIALLPRQLGLAPSLASLIHRSLLESRSPAQTQLRTVINALTNAIPGRNNLSQAGGLRQAMQRSGLFLESLLARPLVRSRAETSRDIKACLLRTHHGLAQYLQGSGARPGHNTTIPGLYDSTRPPRHRALPVPQHRVPLGHTFGGSDIDALIPDLLANANGALARLGLLQAITAENFDNGELIWQLEVPVKHSNAVEVVSMTVEKERSGRPNEADDCWVVNLALDLPRLGPVQIRISLFAQGVSTCFWSDSDSTRAIIERQLEKLRSKLERHGITSLNLCCQQGAPVDPALSDSATPNIDLQA